MSKKANKQKGRYGEALAVKFLQKSGYFIKTVNFRTRYGEIDIIAEKENSIYLVEVRLRKGYQYGTPEESLTIRKLRKLKLMAFIYLNFFKHILSFEIEFISIVIANNAIFIKKYNITEKVMSS